jgi:hypothetical protein
MDNNNSYGTNYSQIVLNLLNTAIQGYQSNKRINNDFIINRERNELTREQQAETNTMNAFKRKLDVLSINQDLRNKRILLDSSIPNFDNKFNVGYRAALKDNPGLTRDEFKEKFDYAERREEIKDSNKATTEYLNEYEKDIENLFGEKNFFDLPGFKGWGK